MTEVKLIPNELYKILPSFDGNKRHLNLFLRTCEYIIDKFKSSKLQEEYLMYVVTSRLTGDAAALISERVDIRTWAEFKELFEIHFGDPRSEECLAIELETLKIKNNESHTDFCARIQSVKSVLLSKVNQTNDTNSRVSKTAIYNNTALQVFLYNLPENMVRIVRLKKPQTLEEALSIVLEEINFYEQYQMRGKMLNSNHNSKPQLTLTSAPQQSFKFGLPQQPTGFRLPMMQQNQPFKNNFGATPKFNFGIPPKRPFNLPQGPHPFQGQFGMNKQNFMPMQLPFGYRPNFGYRPPGYQQMLPMLPQRFGSNNRYGNTIPQQNTQNKPQPNNTDVTMRTAPQRSPQQGFPLNELELYPYNDDYFTNFEGYYYDVFPCEENTSPIDSETENPKIELENNDNGNQTAESIPQVENFCIRASTEQHLKE